MQKIITGPWQALPDQSLAGLVEFCRQHGFQSVTAQPGTLDVSLEGEAMEIVKSARKAAAASTLSLLFRSSNDFATACAEASELARMTGQPITLDFNFLELPVRPETTHGELVASLKQGLGTFTELPSGEVALTFAQTRDVITRWDVFNISAVADLTESVVHFESRDFGHVVRPHASLEAIERDFPWHSLPKREMDGSQERE